MSSPSQVKRRGIAEPSAKALDRICMKPALKFSITLRCRPETRGAILVRQSRNDDSLGAPIPKFASLWSTLACELRNHKEHWQAHDSGAVFRIDHCRSKLKRTFYLICHKSPRATPPAAVIATTTHGGEFHTVSRINAASVRAKSRAFNTAVVHTGL